MPQEHRKRGRKHKRAAERPPETAEEQQQYDQLEHEHAPSWIVKQNLSHNTHNPEAPFGYPSPDIRAYFKTVDAQLQEWTESGHDIGDGDNDPNEDRHAFLKAALKEMSGKERELATDPECSMTLQRLIFSIDDFVKRVLMDRFAGSYVKLVKNRFASHVMQTLLTVGKGTISRELQNIYPDNQNGNTSSGQLLTFTDLILNFAADLLPLAPSLITDPFASHVIRALLLLLDPLLADESPQLSTHHASHRIVRSKKSAAFVSKHGSMSSVLRTRGGAMEPTYSAPPQFSTMARSFALQIRKDLNANEVRALAAEKSASPVLALLLQVEAHHGLTTEPESLFDRVTAGLVTSHIQDPSVDPPSSDYVTALFREPVASHLFEVMLLVAPPFILDRVWRQYFRGSLARLSTHPVANFVVARAMARLSETQLQEAFDELQTVWHKHIEIARTSVMRSAIERASTLQKGEERACQAVETGFILSEKADPIAFVLCVLRLTPFPNFAKRVAEAGAENIVPAESSQKRTHPSFKFSTQGSLILQSLLRLRAPYNKAVVDSLDSLSIPDLIEIAQDPTSSRIIDVFLQAATVPSHAKRKFLLKLLGHYHKLVNNRIGSRVGDQCWMFADIYLREKIARSLIPFETELTGSYYGKFFARNLRLGQLKRQPEEWKSAQSASRKTSRQNLSAASASESDVLDSASPQTTGRKKRKHDSAEIYCDEIDALFTAALGKRIKKGHVKQPIVPVIDGLDDNSNGSVSATLGNVEMDTVLRAIKAAPPSRVRDQTKKYM